MRKIILATTLLPSLAFAQAMPPREAPSEAPPTSVQEALTSTLQAEVNSAVQLQNFYANQAKQLQMQVSQLQAQVAGLQKQLQTAHAAAMPDAAKPEVKHP